MAKPHKDRRTINWEEFEKLASYQCTQAEIAAFFNMSVDTLERICLRDHNVVLAEFWSKRRFMGKVRLRKAQMGIVEKMGPGAATMAIYLDKKMFPEENPDRQLPTPPADLTAENNSKLNAGKVSYKVFCANAGYFEPFAKQEEMRAFAFEETATRLILGARGYGKTDYVTIMGVAYDIYLFPDSSTNLIITKSKSRNKAIINEIGDALQKNGFILKARNSTTIRTTELIGKDDSVEAITIRTSMRGRHHKRIIMDDPVTEEDTSEATRKVVKAKYDEAYKLCKNIVIIGQPAHAHDLYSKLRGIIKTLEVPWGSIPELDADLEAMLAAGVDKNSIEMSYHLRIPPSGQAAFSKIKYIDFFPEGDSVAFLDPSDGGDYTAVTAIRQHFDGVAAAGSEWKMAWYHCLPEIIDFLVKRRVRRLCVETNFGGNLIIDQLQQALAPYGIGVSGKHSDSNKHAVIMAAGSYAPLIYLSKDSDPSYTGHVIEYEYGADFDDAPDSLARCLEWIGLIKGRK